MEESVSERKYDNNEKTKREKRQNSQVALLLMIWRKVQVKEMMTKIKIYDEGENESETTDSESTTMDRVEE